MRRNYRATGAGWHARWPRCAIPSTGSKCFDPPSPAPIERAGRAASCPSACRRRRSPAAVTRTRPPANVGPIGDFRGLAKPAKLLRVKRPVEGDAHLIRRSRPGGHRLRNIGILIRDLVELPLPAGTASPIGPAAMNRDDQVAAVRHARIDREHVEAGNQTIVRHVPGGGLGQQRSIQLGARVTADQRVAAPEFGSKRAPPTFAGSLNVKPHVD